jgi:MoxR-like ATPase
VAPSLKGYIIDVVEATRHERDLVLGVSPRGALALQRASRAYAASCGRDYVIPDDLKLLAGSVLEHRLILSPESQLRGATPADVLESVLGRVPVPSVRAGAGGL